MINRPGHIVQKLYPVITQLEAVDAEALKTSKSHLVRQLHSLKDQYDKEYEELLTRLGSLTQEVLLIAFGEHPSKSQVHNVNAYFIELQMELSNKIGKLAGIDSKICSKYARIIKKVESVDLQVTATKQGQAGPAQPSRGRYNHNPTFLEQGANKNRQQPWYTTASNQMPELDITILEEWLLSGGSYNTYTTHPNSTSHTYLACYYYRKANGLPVSARHHPDKSNDSTKSRSGGTPPPGNGSQNLVVAKVNNDVDSTEIFTSDEEAHGANMAQICDDSESVDSQEYYSD